MKSFTEYTHIGCHFHENVTTTINTGTLYLHSTKCNQRILVRDTVNDQDNGLEQNKFMDKC